MVIIVFWILFGITSILFLIQIMGLVVYRRGVNRSPEFMVACAGSEKPSTPKLLKILNLNWNNFIKEDGSVLDADNYKPFITMGQSMLLGGIQNQDVIFVKETKEIDKLRFPVIVVLKREPAAMVRAARFNDMAERKIRRAWGFCSLDSEDKTILEQVRKIIEGEEFQNLRCMDTSKFPDKDWLIADFSNHLFRYREEHSGCEQAGNEDYMALISTTLDTMQGRVHFSIHSDRTVIGEVKYAFGVNRIVA